MHFFDFATHSSGTYLAVQPSGPSRIAIERLVREMGLQDAEKPMQYHTTVIYSTKPCPEMMNAHIPLPIWGEARKFEIFEPAKEGKKPALVLLVESPELMKLNKELMETYGAISNFPEYKPHITLTFDPPESILEHPVTLNIKYDSYVVTPIETG
jgi:2'-5' RNA ligase